MACMTHSAVMVLRARGLAHKQFSIFAATFVWLTRATCCNCASLRVMTSTTQRARCSACDTVHVVSTTLMTLLVPTGRIITSFAKGLLARAVAAVSRRTRYACRACHCRAARCVRTDHACRALFRRVLRVLVVAATLVALRLAAIGVITRQTTRSL